MEQSLSIIKERVISGLLAFLMVFSLYVADIPVYAQDGETESIKYTVPEYSGEEYNMNFDWKFTKSDSWPLADALSAAVDGGKQFYEPDYDDSGWQDVSLPHTFNDEDGFGNSAASDEGSPVWRGIVFYRKTFSLPEEQLGKKVLIEFEGVRQAAYVWLNGKKVGYYESGIAPFGFDLSEYIVSGENVLAVAVDSTSDRGSNRYMGETVPGNAWGSTYTTDNAKTWNGGGIGFQWNTKALNPNMGGLTRGVKLHVKNKIYQTLPLYQNLKTKGVYIYADDFNIDKKTARINVEAEVRNESGTGADVTLEVAIVDHKGNTAALFESDMTTAAAATDIVHKGEQLSVVPEDAYSEDHAPTETESMQSTIVTASAVCDELRFWSPDDPYLYDVYTVLKKDGEVIDVEVTNTGFRKAEIKGGGDNYLEGGVFINDKHYWVTGYAQRSTNVWAGIGIAPDWLRDYDASLVKESNANHIRWMHVAAQPADIRACDKYGIICTQPAGDREGDVDGRQWDQRMEAMRDVIIYFRNSPSILLYEMGNASISAEHMKEANELKKKLDPYNGRAMGCRSVADTGKDGNVQYAEYVGTMLGRPLRDGSGYTGNGKLIPKATAIFETEYNRYEASRRIWDVYSPPDFQFRHLYTGAEGQKAEGKDAYDLTQEEFILKNIEGYYEIYKDRTQGTSSTPFYSGAAALCWSDSPEMGRQRYSENARMSGKVDPVRIKKPIYYAYSVIQNTDPDVYILGHWNYPEDESEYKYELRYAELPETDPDYDPNNWNYSGQWALRDATNKTVYVIASNVRKVELWVNGELKGTSTSPSSGFIYSFPGIDITEHGEIEARAYRSALDTTPAATQKIVTAGKAETIRLTAHTGPEGFLADGSDVTYVDVEVIDGDGNVCPLNYDKIDFTLDGQGAVFLGGYNSGLGERNTTRKNYVYAECGTNRVFLRSTRKSGKVTLTASRSGWADVSVTIPVKSIGELTETDKNGNIVNIGEEYEKQLSQTGLTTKMPQTMSPDVVPEVIKPTMEKLIPLSKVFAAVFRGENSNVNVISQQTTGEQYYDVIVDGKTINFGSDDKRPYLWDSFIYGPVIPILDKIGTKYEYDSANGVLRVYSGGIQFVITAEQTTMDIIGDPTRDGSLFNEKPTVKNETIYMELNEILNEINNISYHIDKENKQIVISTKEVS